MQKIKTIGILKQTFIDLVDSNLSCQEIILTKEVVNHIKIKHNDDYNKYINELESIIANPDFIGINEKHKESIEFIKKFDDNILVAVKLSIKNELYVASMYHINNLKISKRLANNSIKPIEKKNKI